MSPTTKLSALEKVLGRLDDLDSIDLSNLVQRLARERNLLETVFNTIREGILVIDQNGIIEYANAAGGKLIGLSLKDQGQAVLWKLVPELIRTLDISSNGEYRAEFVVTRDLELNYPETRFVRLYIMPIKSVNDDDLVSKNYAVIISDVTELQLSTREQIENEKISSVIMLAAGVAHELGNPLNSLTIHLQLINRQLEKLNNSNEKEKIKNQLDVCTGELERLDGIITHFLEAIRPSPPDFQDLDLLKALEEAFDYLGEELNDAGINVDIEVSDDLPVVMADGNQIKQVFFNLITNARESMTSGGTIKVRTRNDDEYVYILIGDSGVGIKEENLSKIFQPYFTTKKSGHGLGMMIVQRIMRDHGGQIGIDSQTEVGSVFTLQFPQKHRRIRLLES